MRGGKKPSSFSTCCIEKMGPSGTRVSTPELTLWICTSRVGVAGARLGQCHQGNGSSGQKVQGHPGDCIA